MSHYKPYSTYKDSGVKWLGQVPGHWAVKQIKYLASHIGSGKTPTGGAEVYQDSGVLFLRSQNVYESGLKLEEAAFITDEVDEEMKGSRVRPGDVLLNITGASIGRSCLVPNVFERANVNQHVCIIRSEQPSIAKWMSLCFPSKAIQAQIDFSQNGAGREGLNFEQIGKMLVALPPVSEIDEISRLIDRETTRIDALVDKKTRFIELLREKRQSIVTHAVTKGLEPNAPMKDSGVEWLGKVPAHWRVAPLKYVAEFLSGGTPSKENPDYWNGDVPWASAKDLKQDKLGDTQDHITAHALAVNAAGLVPTASILVVVRGMILARTFPVTETLVPMAINQDLKALIPRKGVISGYLAQLLRGLSAETLSRLEEAGHGTKALRMENWVSMELPVPPEDEQQEILAFLEEETARLDSLVIKTERSIELLKEHRSAFITAAVTGQIDLRDTVAAESQTDLRKTA
ncbi:restriction endonuclease subunit S [Burkholderia anthina]|uniref:restriction endonuclease subunit S n=1 Tax=Burkholderia anthina TaxID=179879 RepID=UPI001ABB0CD0|nr:restriction endonuclease subunit S [Burkholderia anthina]